MLQVYTKNAEKLNAVHIKRCLSSLTVLKFTLLLVEVMLATYDQPLELCSLVIRFIRSPKITIQSKGTSLWCGFTTLQKIMPSLGSLLMNGATIHNKAQQFKNNNT